MCCIWWRYKLVFRGLQSFPSPTTKQPCPSLLFPETPSPEVLTPVLYWWILCQFLSLGPHFRHHRSVVKVRDTPSRTPLPPSSTCTAVLGSEQVHTAVATKLLLDARPCSRRWLPCTSAHDVWFCFPGANFLCSVLCIDHDVIYGHTLKTSVCFPCSQSFTPAPELLTWAPGLHHLPLDPIFQKCSLLPF